MSPIPVSHIQLADLYSPFGLVPIILAFYSSFNFEDGSKITADGWQNRSLSLLFLLISLSSFSFLPFQKTQKWYENEKFNFNHPRQKKYNSIFPKKFE